MRYLLLFTAVMALATVSRAQPGASTAAIGPRPTRIWSDSGYFDINNHLAVYLGNVRVDDPQLKLTCDKMTARTPEQGGRVDDVVAEGHVVVDMVDQQGQTNRAMGDKLVYSYKVVNWVTNDTAVLTGHPRMETAQGKVRGTKITFDRITGLIYVDHEEIEYMQSIAGPTNAPPTTIKPLEISPPKVPAVTNAPVRVPTPPKAPAITAPPASAPPKVSVLNAPKMTNVFPDTNAPWMTNAPSATNVPAVSSPRAGKH